MSAARLRLVHSETANGYELRLVVSQLRLFARQCAPTYFEAVSEDDWRALLEWVAPTAKVLFVSHARVVAEYIELHAGGERIYVQGPSRPATDEDFDRIINERSTR